MFCQSSDPPLAVACITRSRTPSTAARARCGGCGRTYARPTSHWTRTDQQSAHHAGGKTMVMRPRFTSSLTGFPPTDAAATQSGRRRLCPDCLQIARSARLTSEMALRAIRDRPPGRRPCSAPALHARLIVPGRCAVHFCARRHVCPPTALLPARKQMHGRLAFPQCPRRSLASGAHNSICALPASQAKRLGFSPGPCCASSGSRRGRCIPAAGASDVRKASSTQDYARDQKTERRK